MQFSGNNKKQFSTLPQKHINSELKMVNLKICISRQLMFPEKSIHVLTLLTKACVLQVKASAITIEADYVQKGIVDLVNKHGIRKLVMGAVPEK